MTSGLATAPYWPAGTVYGTLPNFRDEVSALGPQMTQLPYKAPPQAPALFVKTANTWSRNGDYGPLGRFEFRSI